MLIRCEKCSTLYELDDALLPPQGAAVQCGRCQFVFTAMPERPAPRPAVVGDHQRNGADERSAGAPAAANEPLPDERGDEGAAGEQAGAPGDGQAPVSRPEERAGPATAEATEGRATPQPDAATAVASTASPSPAATTTAENPSSEEEARAPASARSEAAATPAEDASAAPRSREAPEARDRPVGAGKVSPPAAEEPARGAAPAAVERPSYTPPPLPRGVARASRPAATPVPASAEAPTAPATASAPPEAPRFTADGRPIRKVAFPDEELSPVGPRPVIARAPGRVTARSGTRPRLPLVPLAVAAVVALLAFLGWRLVARRVDPGAVGRRAEGQRLLLRDDRVSLTRAVVAFDDAARLDEKLVDARAERVLARALLLGLVEGEAARVEAALQAREAEERRGAGLGPPAPGAEELEALRGQRDALRARVRELEAVATSDLASIPRRDADRPAVQRARAVLDAYAADRARAAEAVLRDRPARGKDPWVDLAVGVGEARAVSPELRAEGVARLEALVKAHPELLRGRLALAEALARAGRGEAAVAALDALLAANRDHDDARALRAELVASRQGSGAAPPGGSAVPQPRNESSQERGSAEP